MTGTILVKEGIRNPERSRDAILEAAEELFAERGFEATSLAEVGLRAGVSRATPGYFFGSKAELYRAVLDRAFSEARQAIATGWARSRSKVTPVKQIIEGVVSDYYDFLDSRRNFVKLMEREALGTGPLGEDALIRLEVGREAVAALGEELSLGVGVSEETAKAHLVLNIVALCWFPLVHGHTLVRAIGLNPDSPDFADQRKREIADLLAFGVTPLLRNQYSKPSQANGSTLTAPPSPRSRTQND